MQPITLYILHKTGAPSHYIGLQKLAEDHNAIVEQYSCFSWFKLFKAVIGLKIKRIGTILRDYRFKKQLETTKNRKVVFAFAPYDKHLLRYKKCFSRHQCYYHTSWASWNADFFPKKTQNARVLEVWRAFLTQQVKHIFAVSQKSKQELLLRYPIQEAHISVVYHAHLYKPTIPNQNKKAKPTFLYVGRLIHEKGIEELLAFFTKDKRADLVLVGTGKLEKEVLRTSQQNKNIAFLGYKSGDSLQKVYRDADFLILNPKKSTTWEELFGMVLIEAMANGVLPIAVNHSGPSEIIDDSFGWLFNEGELCTTLHTILENMSVDDLKSKQKLAHKNSEKYYVNEIAKRWKKILT